MLKREAERLANRTEFWTAVEDVAHRLLAQPELRYSDVMEIIIRRVVENG